MLVGDDVAVGEGVRVGVFVEVGVNVGVLVAVGEGLGVLDAVAVGGITVGNGVSNRICKLSVAMGETGEARATAVEGNVRVGLFCDAGSCTAKSTHAGCNMQFANHRNENSPSRTPPTTLKVIDNKNFSLSGITTIRSSAAISIPAIEAVRN